MRIAFPILGGAEWTGGVNYLFNLCRVVTENAPGAMRATLIYSQDQQLDDCRRFQGMANVDVIQAPVAIGSREHWLKALALGRDAVLEKWFDDLGIDLIFEASGYFGWRTRRAVLAWVPDFQHRTIPHMFSYMTRWQRDVRLAAQIHSGRTILLSSKDAQRDCLRWFPAASGKTVVAQFAISPDVPRAPAKTIAERYALPERFFFLPNQFWRHKNHLGLIEALALLKDRLPDLCIAASGNPKDIRHPKHFSEVTRRIADLGVGHHLRMLGFIPYEDVTELMRRASALVNPSFCEGWSSTVEEAKALGVPLVLSSLPVHQEQAGETAIYFDPGSPVDIAEGLEKAWHRFDAPGDIDRAQSAFPAAKERVDEYVRAFLDAARTAVLARTV